MGLFADHMAAKTELKQLKEQLKTVLDRVAELERERDEARKTLDAAKQTADAEFVAKLRAQDMTRTVEARMAKLEADNARLREVAEGLFAFWKRIGNGQHEKLDALVNKARAALGEARP